MDKTYPKNSNKSNCSCFLPQNMHAKFLYMWSKKKPRNKCQRFARHLHYTTMLPGLDPCMNMLRLPCWPFNSYSSSGSCIWWTANVIICFVQYPCWTHFLDRKGFTDSTTTCYAWKNKSIDETVNRCHAIFFMLANFPKAVFIDWMLKISNIMDGGTV